MAVNGQYMRCVLPQPQQGSKLDMFQIRGVGGQV
jgi:hypothetical protein